MAAQPRRQPEPAAARSCVRSCARRRCARRPTPPARRSPISRPTCAAAGGGAARAPRAGWRRRAPTSARGRWSTRMLEQFPLDSAQGKALMSLAEALLRTPDPKRADQLIAERLATVRARRRAGRHRPAAAHRFHAAGRGGPPAAGRVCGAVRGLLGGQPHQAADRADRARGAAPVDAAARRRLHRRRDHRRGAGARPRGSGARRCARSTCWARARAPTPTRSATSRPMPTRSRR